MIIEKIAFILTDPRDSPHRGGNTPYHRGLREEVPGSIGRQTEEGEWRGRAFTMVSRERRSDAGK